MGIRENKVERYLDDEVKSVGGITRKWESRNYAGVPDRIVIFKGQVWFVEVKTVTGKLSVRQKREQAELAANGANVITVFGKNDVDEFVREICLRDLTSTITK